MTNLNFVYGLMVISEWSDDSLEIEEKSVGFYTGYWSYMKCDGLNRITNVKIKCDLLYRAHARLNGISSRKVYEKCQY